MANTTIQIKRSSSTSTPSDGSLAAGELAYSYNSDRLFLGTANGAKVMEVGGRYWLDTVTQAFNTANAGGASGNAGFNVANAAFYHSNAAFDKANAANVLAYNALPQTGGTISGDLGITGNLTISGNVTFINTQTLEVGDNIIVLNSDVQPTDVPTQDAGLEINRGSESNTSIIWNEMGNKWTLTNDGSTWYNIATNADIISVSVGANTYADSVGLAGNNYTNAVGVAGNNYAIQVGAASNTWANTKVSSVSGTVGEIYSSGGTTPTLNLISTSVTATTYGGATQIPVFTVDSYGRLTYAANVAVQGMDYAYANQIGAASNTYADSVGLAGNNYTNSVGLAGNNYTNAVGVSGNNYTIEVGAASNTWANSVGTAGNNYTNSVGQAGNNYTNSVGQAGNNYTNAVGLAGNNYTDAVGLAGNNYTNAVGVAGNNYTNSVGEAGNNYTNSVGEAGNNYAVFVGSSANTYANLTYLKLTAPSQTITGDLSITGNVFLLGNATTLSTNNVIISDSLIYLAANNDLSDILDIGFVGHYSNGTANLHTGLYRDHASKQYYLFNDLGGPEPASSNEITPYANGMINATLHADLITSNLNLGGANAITWINSLYPYANGVANSANSYALDMAMQYGLAANNHADAVGVSANLYSAAVGVSANSYALDMAMQYGLAANNHADAVGVSANSYADSVSNEAKVAANNHADAVGVSANSYAALVAGYANTNAANASYINTGTLAVLYGGTGLSSATANGILYGDGTNAFKVTSAGTDGQVLQSDQGVPKFAMLDGGSF